MATSYKLYQEVEDDFKFPRDFPAENLGMVKLYKPRSGDYFVAGYPKCGTNWLQFILYLIFHNSQPPKNGIEFRKRVSLVDLGGMELVESMPRPAIFKTHLPYELCPKSSDAKYLFVARNPKDCCVSNYYLYLALYRERPFENFEEYFEVFMKGEKDYGDYFNNLASWYRHRNDPNVFFITYEEMKEDHRGSVLKVAEFLGEDYRKTLTELPEMLDDVVKYSGIDYMKSMKSATQEFVSASDQEREAILEDPTIPAGLKQYMVRSKNNKTVISIVRKGIVGDWRSHFTPEMNQRMNEKIEARLGGTELLALWNKLGCI